MSTDYRARLEAAGAPYAMRPQHRRSAASRRRRLLGTALAGAAVLVVLGAVLAVLGAGTPAYTPGSLAASVTQAFSRPAKAAADGFTLAHVTCVQRSGTNVYDCLATESTGAQIALAVTVAPGGRWIAHQEG